MNIYKKRINFLKFHKAFLFCSLFIFLGSLLIFFLKGLNLGIDFRGGTIIEMKVETPVKSETIRQELLNLNLGDVKVKEFGKTTQFLAIFEKKGSSNDFINNIKLNLTKKLNQNIDFQRVEVVGPKISEELSKKGYLAVFIALICMLIYIWFRFEWQFSIGSILALAHDVFITIGVF